MLDAPIEQLRLSGHLPMAELGRREAQAMRDTLLPMLRCWVGELARRPHELPKQLLQFESDDGIVIADWLTGVRVADPGAAVADGCWIELTPSRVTEKTKGREKSGNKPRWAESPRLDKLLRAWVTTLLASACGQPAGGIVVGRDAIVVVGAIERESAVRTLSMLLRLWRDGMAAPLPLPLKTALAAVTEKRRPVEVYEGGFQSRGEVEDDACLARVFADFDTLNADGRFEELAERVFSPLIHWVNEQVKADAHDDAPAAEEEAD